MEKKLISLACICLSISFFSCGNNSKNPDNETKTTPTPGSDQSNTKSNPNNTPVDTMKNNTGEKPGSNDKSQSGTSANPIRLNFPAGATQMTIMGNIEGLGDNLTYIFEVSKGQKLTASLITPGSKGNVRFNQIFDPSGNADGPFSNEMTYNLNQSGDWKLVVGESNMLGEPYTGKYEFKIQIK